MSCSTWRLIRLVAYVDSVGVSRHLAFHSWCTNQTEAYDLGADPYQLNDISSSLPTADLHRLTALSVVLGGCKGALCSAPLSELTPLADAVVESSLAEMGVEEVRLYLCEDRDKHRLPKAWVCNVVHTITEGKFSVWVDNHI